MIIMEERYRLIIRLTIELDDLGKGILDWDVVE